jgi:hypothetical protein
MYRCSWLGMSQFFEGESKNDSLFAIEEESAKFCLGRQGHNETEDGA